jgi:hypothetical protein
MGLGCGFESGEEEPSVELFDEEFGAFLGASPDDGAAELVDFEHVFFRARFREAEDFLKNLGDVGHEIDGVVVDDDIPRETEKGFGEAIGFGEGFGHDWGVNGCWLS